MKRNISLITDALLLQSDGGANTIKLLIETVNWDNPCAGLKKWRLYLPVVPEAGKTYETSSHTFCYLLEYLDHLQCSSCVFPI